MNETNHERARKLLLAALIEDIAPTEREWLEGHLEGCVECAKEADALAAAVGSIQSFPVTASRELVQRTRNLVHMRAEQLAAMRPRSAPLWIATVISSFCMIATAPYVWSVFSWFGRMAHVPVVLPEIGFLMWWFLPATVLAAAAAWRHRHSDILNWGQR